MEEKGQGAEKGGVEVNEVDTVEKGANYTEATNLNFIETEEKQH